MQPIPEGTGESAAASGSRSIQERYFPAMTCFGCGPANAKGLRLRSYPAVDRGQDTVADDPATPDAATPDAATPDAATPDAATADAASDEWAEADLESLVLARFTPWPEHDNGLGYLNGGIISTVLDCHSAAAVVRESVRRGITTMPDGTLPYVTAGIDVRFLRPTPLTEPLELRAYIVRRAENEVIASAEIVWDGKPRASANSVWKRWRPR